MSRARRQGLRRFETGVEPLDRILGGGLPVYSVVILAGEPGTGKTILSQQILFANAARGRKGLYLTTVSESPIKAARYQSEFSFFDAEKFGEAVVYLDLGEIIRRHKLSNAVEMIAEALREHQPEVVVIDSFKAIHDLSPTPQEMRSFTYDLAVELSAVQATTLLVGEYVPEEIGKTPEFAVADGIIWLQMETGRIASGRTLQVVKMRGASHPVTPFSFEINRDGLNIFALPPPVIEERRERGAAVATGVPGLDELLRGGIPAGSPVLVSGEAGTGKTTFGVQYLHHGAAVLGEKCAYFSYEEPPAQIILNARSFGWDLDALIQKGLLAFHHMPLSAVNMDAEILKLRQALTGDGVRRVLIDSLTMLGQAIQKPEILRRHVFDIDAVLRASGATGFIITDPPAGSGLVSRFGVEESIVDGVIVLRSSRIERERKRFIEVYKMRGVAHATGEHLLRITPEGLKVFPRSEEVVR